jgi:parvulin-like peptidyl-prolyl isomerase
MMNAKRNKSLSHRVSLIGFALGMVCFSPWVSAETVDKVVAVVNEDPITLYDLDSSIEKNREKIKEAMGEKAADVASKDIRTLALKVLIDEKLLDQELAKKQITITPEDEQKAIQNVLERNKLNLEQLKAELAKKGQAWPAYKTALLEQLRRIKFMGQVIAPRVKVTDADLDEFFAKNPEQFAQFQSVKMAQVIVPLGTTAGDVELVQAQKTAREVQDKARGGADFEELGKKYSTNPQTAVPDTFPLAQLAPQIASLLGDLKPGDISEPVRSSMGIHVIKLYERKTLAGDDFKAIREQIREKVFEFKVEQALQEYLEDVKSKSFIEIKA